MSNYPMFDNISIYKNKLNIAIFNYNQFWAYYIMHIKLLEKIIIDIFSFTLGVAYYDIHNNNRKLTGKGIQFVNYDTVTRKKTFYTIDFPFDETNTQIVQVNEETFYATNWKANKMFKIKKIITKVVQ